MGAATDAELITVGRRWASTYLDQSHPWPVSDELALTIGKMRIAGRESHDILAAVRRSGQPVIQEPDWLEERAARRDSNEPLFTSRYDFETKTWIRIPPMTTNEIYGRGVFRGER